MFHRETDADKVARNRDAIFDLHARALEFLEDYTTFPYPFGKFDFVVIPAFQFGGMEHAGKILYNASGLMLDESATQNQLLGRASVIAHETAHMWFGDLVTMRWFNDVWMKEVFANFMAAKIVNPSFPTVNHDLRFLLVNYPAAYEVDRTPGANPIRQPLDNLNEAGSLYGAIIYQKAPVIMRHLEALLGEDNFRDGLREYLKAHAFANATWSDLIAILDARTPMDLAAWSQVWVDQPGRPIDRDESRDRSNGTISRLAFRQRDPRGPQPDLAAAAARRSSDPRSSRRPFNVELNGAEVEVPQAVGLPAPLYVLPNAGGWAYGDFLLDTDLARLPDTSLPEIDDPLTRGSAWVTLWDSLLERPGAAGDVPRSGDAGAAARADEQLTPRLLGYTSNTVVALPRLLPSATTRAARSKRCSKGLARRARPARRRLVRRAAQHRADARHGAWLRRCGTQKETVPGLPLAETDYTTLALELAVREVDGWSDILDDAAGRIENPDRKARFEFVMPALYADARVREQWFAALEDVNNRRHEPWVLEGLNYLHHPLRADASQQFVAPSLALLWDIQKTGDIFFPKRWLDATLGGHNQRRRQHRPRISRELPANYPARLKNITLQSADELFRAAGRYVERGSTACG